MAAPAVARPGRRGLLRRLGIRSLSGREAATGYAMVVPIYVFFLAVVFVPMLFAFYLSLIRWDGLKPIGQASFLGLGNYAELAADERFRWSLYHDLEFAVETFVGEIALGLALALIVNQAKRFIGVTRFFVFAPVVLPVAAVAVLFARLMMNPTYGTFNVVLTSVGLPASQWIYHPDSAMFSIVLTTIWKSSGYYMILFLAALQGIPEVYYEAAHIDGAGRLATFRYITLPLLKPALLFICVINLISNLQAFSQIWVMTSGGPSRATEVLVVLIYNTAFGYFKLSYAATIAVVLFFLILFLTLVQIRVLRRGGFEEY
ncbi:MAG TPA: sugar ABC transporter permease [Chloroflexota bacterium]|jgi:ABC-type sugar transport system permease subunit|nr:sugar ABC transporter permease [Chloroflexota bacterium]